MPPRDFSAYVPHPPARPVGGRVVSVYGEALTAGQNQIVAINRARVADAMGVTIDNLVTVHQVHSADAVTVSGPLSDRPRADALVTATEGVALAVLTADCQFCGAHYEFDPKTLGFEAKKAEGDAE